MAAFREELSKGAGRISEKAGSVRAVCLLVLVLTLCYMCVINPDVWRTVFESAIMFLLGNYVGRADRQPPPNNGGSKP